MRKIWKEERGKKRRIMGADECVYVSRLCTVRFGRFSCNNSATTEKGGA